MSIRDLLIAQAIDDNALSQGLAAYQKGQVRNLEVRRETEEDSAMVAQSIDALVDDYRCWVLIHADGTCRCNCTCGAPAEHQEQLCQHGVAALRAASDVITPERQVDENARTAVVESMLEAYQPTPLPSGTAATAVHLFPTLDFDPYSLRFSLAFRIGHQQKSYVLKNLSDFTQRMRHGERYSYGKWLLVNHERRSFDEESQFYLDLITNSVSLINYGRNLFETDFGVAKRYLYLTAPQLDQVFDHVVAHGGEIECQINAGDTMSLRMAYENPPGTLMIARRPDGRYSCRLRIHDYTIFYGERNHYLYTQKEMIRPSQAYQQEVLPFLAAIQKAPGGDLILNEDELTRFIAFAEPALRKHLMIEMDADLHERLLPPDLQIHLQLEYPSSTTIRGLLRFQYGERRFNPLDKEEDEPVYRNHTLEQDFLNRLWRYRFSANEDELLLTGEDAMFTFLHEGLLELMPLATIDVEKRLRDIAPRSAQGPRLVATMSHGLIELSYDKDKFPQDELVAILDAYREKKRFIRLTNGTFLDIVQPEIAQLSALLEDLGEKPKALREDHIVTAPYRAGYLTELAAGGRIPLSTSDDLALFAERLNHPEALSLPMPEGLHATMRPYQQTGLKWFVNLSEMGMGGILADDMGLGKTVQTIAFLLYRHQQNPNGRFLIVVPTSLIYNWQEELDRFAPSLVYHIVTGPAEERRKMIRALPKGCLAITSYATLRRDRKDYEAHGFDTIIADEAQYIKNSSTQNARALKALKADHRFALTGTPMENALADLWSILDFCMPGYLHSWQTFRNVYEIPIARYDDSERLERLQKQVSPFLLRRIKKDVLAELPDKIETTLYAELSGEEARIYESQLALSQKTFIESLSSHGNMQSRIRILALLMRLRQVCCSPQLFLDGFDHPSAKLKLALELIRERRTAGHRMVLFSQFTTMLDLIAKALDEMDIPYLLLTGQTRPGERMQLVNRFQNSEIPIFLISLKAGGVGLNLTAADTVIHYDPWWNQSVENQATDRTHRIGQKETVHVIRLICKNTIEEKIMALKEKKAQLADSVVGEEKGFLGSLSEEDLRDLFEIPPEFNDDHEWLQL